MHTILLLAPDEAHRPGQPLSDALRAVGYVVRCLSLAEDQSAQALCRLFAGCPPDILLADLSDVSDCLPLRHTRHLLQNAWGNDLPLPLCVALITAHHLALADLPALADDFLLPPFSPDELRARLALLLFRRRHAHAPDVLTLADVTLDLAGRRVLDAPGNVLALTPREFDLLRFLRVHRGRFFARDRLLDMVWGVDFEGGERTVDIHMRRLRVKLTPEASALLETRRGGGYGIPAA